MYYIIIISHTTVYCIHYTHRKAESVEALLEEVMVRLRVVAFDKLHGAGLRDMLASGLRLRGTRLPLRGSRLRLQGSRWNNNNINNDNDNRVGVDDGRCMSRSRHRSTRQLLQLSIARGCADQDDDCIAGSRRKGPGLLVLLILILILILIRIRIVYYTVLYYTILHYTVQLHYDVLHSLDRHQVLLDGLLPGDRSAHDP